jgi:hypothetical protein
MGQINEAFFLHWGHYGFARRGIGVGAVAGARGMFAHNQPSREVATARYGHWHRRFDGRPQVRRLGDRPLGPRPVGTARGQLLSLCQRRLG